MLPPPPPPDVGRGRGRGLVLPAWMNDPSLAQKAAQVSGGPTNTTAADEMELTSDDSKGQQLMGETNPSDPKIDTDVVPTISSKDAETSKAETTTGKEHLMTTAPNDEEHVLTMTKDQNTLPARHSKKDSTANSSNSCSGDEKENCEIIIDSKKEERDVAVKEVEDSHRNTPAIAKSNTDKEEECIDGHAERATERAENKGAENKGAEEVSGAAENLEGKEQVVEKEKDKEKEEKNVGSNHRKRDKDRSESAGRSTSSTRNQQNDEKRRRVTSQERRNKPTWDVLPPKNASCEQLCDWLIRARQSDASRDNVARRAKYIFHRKDFKGEDCRGDDFYLEEYIDAFFSDRRKTADVTKRISVTPDDRNSFCVDFEMGKGHDSYGKLTLFHCRDGMMMRAYEFQEDRHRFCEASRRTSMTELCDKSMVFQDMVKYLKKKGCDLKVNKFVFTDFNESSRN